MSLPPITAVNASLTHLAAQLRAETLPAPSAVQPVSAAVAPGAGFSDLIRNGLAVVTHAQNVAGADQRAFAAGAPDAPSLAQTMLAGQKKQYRLSGNDRHPQRTGARV